jgi:uncharacterized protein (TIGR02145 family)
MEVRPRKLKISIYIALAAIVSLVMLVFVFFLATPTSALENSTSAKTQAHLNSVLSFTIASCDTAQSDYLTNTKITVQPGRQSNQCQNVTVDTNASAGYSLTMQATGTTNNGSNNTSANDLVHTTISPNPPVIPATSSTIASPSALADTATGTWGFAVPKTQANSANLYGSFAPAASGFDSTYTAETNLTNSPAKYAPVPTANTTLASTDQFNANPDTYNLYFAVRVPNNKPGGTYQTTITYTVVADELPEPPPYLARIVDDNNITTMQELTSALCDSADWDDTDDGINDNNTVILTDQRNGQNYQVRKLVDDKCWMINNLRISLGDVANAPASQTQAGADLASLAAVGPADNTVSDTFTDPKWYDPTCGVSGSFNSECGDTANTSDHFYGYLYNWCAATGADSSACTYSFNTMPSAATSICPANWRLPKGGGVGNPDNDFDVLNARMRGFDSNNNFYYNHGSYNDSTFARNWMFDGPFQGVFSGDWEASVFHGQGDSIYDKYGGYWSASASPTADYGYYDYTYALMLYGQPEVYTNAENYRSSGYAVRCLVD